MIENLIGLLFASRDYAHRAHLKSVSHAEHVALGKFYEEVIDLADRLTEAYQGRMIALSKSATRLNIPYIDEASVAESPTQTLIRHLTLIQEVRYQAVSPKETALQNIIDEVVALYYSSLYQLSLA